MQLPPRVTVITTVSDPSIHDQGDIFLPWQ